MSSYLTKTKGQGLFEEVFVVLLAKEFPVLFLSVSFFIIITKHVQWILTSATLIQAMSSRPIF